MKFTVKNFDAVPDVVTENEISSTPNTTWINITWDPKFAEFKSGAADIFNQLGNAVNGGNPINLVTSTVKNEFFWIGALDAKYIEIPDSIIGITRIYKPDSSSIGMWDIRYQMRLSDLTTFGSYSGGYQLLSYEMRMKNISLIEELLTGEIPIRFNRHMNRLYVDFDWGSDAVENEFLVVEAAKIVDPDKYVEVYSDRWLKEFATALIKEQWGMNLGKYDGVQLPGGVTLNGRAILEDARTEIERLKEELSTKYELPVDMMMA